MLFNSGCDMDIALSCVLDHHEKANGHSYPRGKPAMNISPYARITCIADIYDALTTDRPYRKAMIPRDAVLLMSQQMQSELDPQFLSRLIAAVGCFTDVSSVRSGKNAREIAANRPPKDPPRPVSHVIQTYQGIDMRC